MKAQCKSIKNYDANIGNSEGFSEVKSDQILFELFN